MARRPAGLQSYGVPIFEHPHGPRRDEMLAALWLERDVRERLAEQVHDDVLQSLVAALLMIDAAQHGAGTADDALARAKEILAEALARGRRSALGALSPGPQPLRFTLTSLLEESGIVGSVEAPADRYPAPAELDVYHLVQDALQFTEGDGPVRVVVAGDERRLFGSVHVDAVREGAMLTAALNCRLSLHGGFARMRQSERGVVLAFERPLHDPSGDNRGRGACPTRSVR